MYMLKQIPEDFIVEEIPAKEMPEKGEYAYFLLEKKNYDTEAAIQFLSKEFNIPRKYFSYAGNKDRQAITRQYCSVRGNIRDKEFAGFRIKAAGRGSSPISLGDLKGNRFKITVRNLGKEDGFVARDTTINYFDEQRFGRHNLEIGLAILKKDFRQASSLVDAQEAKTHLISYPNDCIGAIKKVPFRTMMLYLHSVQSLLWNEAASEYVRSKSRTPKIIPYSKGIFAFSQEDLEDTEIPLISFDTGFEAKEIGRLYEMVLEKNNISLRDFIIRQMPEITPSGGSRQLLSRISSLVAGEMQEDDLNPGMKKITLEFELAKGCYATIAIKDMFGI